MKNPFKFGTIVDGQFFTDRTRELQYVQQMLRSENHLVLISPRRFGKSSLVNKALTQTERKHILINMQNVTSVQNFTVRLMSALFRLYPGERLKHLMTHFRIVPTISTNPMNGSVDVSFNPSMNTDVMLEDAMEHGDRERADRFAKLLRPRCECDRFRMEEIGKLLCYDAWTDPEAGLK